jgi:hypothetical protein
MPATHVKKIITVASAAELNVSRQLTEPSVAAVVGSNDTTVAANVLTHLIAVFLNHF